MESELEKYRKRKQVEAYKTQIRTKLGRWWTRITDTIKRALLPEKYDEGDSSDDEEVEVPRSPFGSTITTTSRGQRTLRSDADNASQLKSRRRRPKSALGTKTESDDDNDMADTDIKPDGRLYYVTFVCKIAIWICLFMGCVKLEVGAIFFIISAFWFIWQNMSTGRKKGKRKDALSAYSVFNPNCEAIDGTLKAEQLEKQLLFRETK